MKDEKGHGSNARGGSYPNIDRSGFRKGQHVGYGNGTFRIVNTGNGYRATEQRTGESFTGDSLGHISSQLTDRAAAAELARGSQKSAVVPAHAGTVSGNQMDAYLRYARGFTGSGAIKEPGKRNVGSEK